MNPGDIRDLILEKGCFSLKENTRIYEGYFKKMAKYLDYNLKKYKLDKKKVLDVGCCYGHNLIHFGQGSIGIDANPKYVKFARSLGLKCLEANLEEHLPMRPSSFRAAWCSNVLEHMIAPHLLLLRLHRLLKNGGFIFIYVPLTTNWLLRRLSGFKDYLARDHINFFTPETLRLTLERSGFRVVEINAAVSYSFKLNNWLNPLFTTFFPGLTAVGKKKSGFIYPDERLTVFSPSWLSCYKKKLHRAKR